MKRIRVTLAAYTRVEWAGVVEVPDDFDEDLLTELAQAVYDKVDGGEYEDDPLYWEEADSFATDVVSTDDCSPAAYRARVAEDGSVEVEAIIPPPATPPAPDKAPERMSAVKQLVLAARCALAELIGVVERDYEPPILLSSTIVELYEALNAVGQDVSDYARDYRRIQQLLRKNKQ